MSFIYFFFVVHSYFILFSLGGNLKNDYKRINRRLSFNHSYDSLPATSNSMSDVKILLDLLAKGIPFGYSHFNDGEVILINDCPEGKETDWGWQKCSPAIGKAMFNAMTKTAPNFYIGITCLCEFEGNPFFKSLSVLNISHEQLNDPPLQHKVCPDKPPVLKFPDEAVHPYLKQRLTVATIFINGNYHKSKREFVRILNDIASTNTRSVHIVTGEGHKTNNLPFKVKSTFHAAALHAFEHNYPEMRTIEFLNKHYNDGDVVLIMLGPVGRILSSEWTLLKSTITFIDLGSFWDKELWGRNYELAAHRACMFKEDIVGHR